MVVPTVSKMQAHGGLFPKNPLDVVDNIWHGGESPIEEVTAAAAQLRRCEATGKSVIPLSLLPAGAHLRDHANKHSYHEVARTDSKKDFGDEAMHCRQHLAFQETSRDRQNRVHSPQSGLEPGVPDLFSNTQAAQLRCACRHCYPALSPNFEPHNFNWRYRNNDELFLPSNNGRDQVGGWVEDTVVDVAPPWHRSPRLHPSYLPSSGQGSTPSGLPAGTRSHTETQTLGSTRTVKGVTRKPIGNPATAKHTSFFRLQRLPSVKLLHPRLAAIPKSKRYGALHGEDKSSGVPEEGCGGSYARRDTSPGQLGPHYRHHTTSRDHPVSGQSSTRAKSALPPPLALLFEILLILATAISEAVQCISPPPSALSDLVAVLFDREDISSAERSQKVLRCAWPVLWFVAVAAGGIWMLRGSRDLLASCLDLFLPVKLLWWLLRWLLRP